MELLSVTVLLPPAGALSGLSAATASKHYGVDGVLGPREEEEGARTGGKLLVTREGGRELVTEMAGQNLRTNSIFDGDLHKNSISEENDVLAAALALPCNQAELVLDPVSF